MTCLRIALQSKQPLLDEPLVHAESALQRLRTVVGHNQHCRIVVEELEDSPDLFVQMRVEVGDHILVWIA